MAQKRDNGVEIHEASRSLARLVERAAAGEEVILTKTGRPVARLVPVVAPKATRRPGGWRGQVHIAPEFDAQLPEELEKAFEGETEGGATR
jgi:prevent-host-death family protein